MSVPNRMCLLPLLLLVSLYAPAKASGTPAAVAIPGAACSSCADFDRLTTLVRDGRIERSQARKEMAGLLEKIKGYYYAHGGRDYDEKEWVFPLKGYNARAIGGGRRHGYEPRGYDYFDGNRHGGHPSFDIFIGDRRQDMRDRRTGDYVPVLSLTGGIVVARETGWEPGSKLRGGKYLWIYDPAADALVYYAHNREVTVAVGDLVTPGQMIASVGRTGFNAFKRRSPTHLHLTLLRYASGRLRPDYIYPQLLKVRTTP